MNMLEKTVTTMMMFAYLSGCSATNRTVKKHRMDYIQICPKAISYSGLAIPKPGREGVSSDAEELISYLNFIDKYQTMTDKVMELTMKGDFCDVEIHTRDLARCLEHDPSPYAKQELELVKNYNYTLLEVSDVVDQETKKSLGIGWDAPAVLPFAVFDLGMDILSFASGLFTLDPHSMTFEETRGNFKRLVSEDTEEKLMGRTFDVVKVYPYSGRRVVLKRGINYDQIKGFLGGSQ